MSEGLQRCSRRLSSLFALHVPSPPSAGFTRLESGPVWWLTGPVDGQRGDTGLWRPSLKRPGSLRLCVRCLPGAGLLCCEMSRWLCQREKPGELPRRLEHSTGAVVLGRATGLGVRGQRPAPPLCTGDTGGLAELPRHPRASPDAINHCRLSHCI